MHPCLSKAFANYFFNFLSHKKSNEHPLGCFGQHSGWNTCPMTLVLYFLHENKLGVITEPSLLGEHCPWCSMTLINQQTHVAYVSLKHSLIQNLHHIHLLKHNQHIMNTISLIGAL